MATSKPLSEAARARKNFKARVESARRAGYSLSDEARYVLANIQQYSAAELNYYRREQLVGEDVYEEELLLEAEHVIEGYDNLLYDWNTGLVAEGSHREGYGAGNEGATVLTKWWSRLKYNVSARDLANMIIRASNDGIFLDIELRYDAQKALAFIVKMNAYLPVKYRMTVQEMRDFNDEAEAESGEDYLL